MEFLGVHIISDLRTSYAGNAINLLWGRRGRFYVMTAVSEIGNTEHGVSVIIVAPP